jgi:hypothetical protein
MDTLANRLQQATLTIALEPACNALNSFALLIVAEQWQGLNTWVIKTARTLSERQKYTNRLLFTGLSTLFFSDAYEIDFPAYLDRLVRQDAHYIRDHYLHQVRIQLEQRIISDKTGKDGITVPTNDQVLRDEQTYLSLMEYLIPAEAFDRQLYREVHALLNDTPVLQQVIVSHLTFLWDDLFASEWKRVQRTLQTWTEMYRNSMDPGWSLAEALYTFTGRHSDSSLVQSAEWAEHIVLVPSWHSGWHDIAWQRGKTLLVFFSEPSNYNNVEVRGTVMGEGELRMRMIALGDETRLRIVQLLMQRDEWEAQELIAELGLSQSSVSRHLKTLVALGYLYERRGEGANKTYRLCHFFFERTARAIERLVSGERFETTHQPELDQDLKRFLDGQGRLLLWPPSRQRDKIIILDYLASFFKPGQQYSEREVNELLLAHSAIKDPAALRRAFTEYHFMDRRRDGSAYWLTGTEVNE